eukprot:TRINITY_DN3408_c0_g2_i1.p4 TRINITY_DN3408_c0_g2~~TRINITY_DN3408_c0_g2_i1.p4  ORF type:complete len:124 (+),score=27.37 TRINITY_DN3408_c0_g2_i1:477-848(+)
MENIFVEPAREYRAPRFSRFGGMAPFAHNSAAPEMFFEKDEFSSLLEDDKELCGRQKEHVTPKVKTRKSAVVNNVGLGKRERGQNVEQVKKPPRASVQRPRNTGKAAKKATKNVNKEKCSEYV